MKSISFWFRSSTSSAGLFCHYRSVTSSRQPRELGYRRRDVCAGSMRSTVSVGCEYDVRRVGVVWFSKIYFS